MNEITAFIDGSNIYGSDKETCDKLRSHTDGLMKTHSKFEASNLPMQSQCNLGSRGIHGHGDHPSDLVAGDTRATIQPALVAMHTLFLNEHNRIAKGIKPFLAKKTLHMTSKTQDELIFQAVIASFTVSQFAP